MSIKIGWYKTPVPDGKEDKGLLHARLVPQGTVNMEMMCKFISSSSSFSSADVKGILEALNFWVGLQLAEGRIVDLEGLGHFSPTLKTTVVQDDKGKEKLEARVDGVAFRCATSLKKQVREADLEVVKRKKKEVPDLPARKKNIKEYVRKHLSINSTICMKLNSCSRYLALKDLQELVKDGKLVETGNGKQTMYIRPY